MSEQTLIKVIDARLNGHGTVIVEEAKGRLDLALACALVDHESMGGQNIFGADHGLDIGDHPPYARHPVTKERVQRLINQPGYREGRAPMNGVGLTQLTWYEFVLEAEALGGAHLPRYQCRVGFQHLCDLISELGYALGIGAYNAGWDNAQLGIDNGYYDKIAAAHEGWKTRLGEAAGKVEWPTRIVKTDEKSWLVDEAGNYLKAPGMPGAKFATNANEWMYAGSAPPKPLPPMPNPVKPPPMWQWPRANAAPIPNSPNYVERHPTRYNWRVDVEKIARRLVDNYDVWCNTYHHHPPGGEWWARRDATSIDVWGPAGRGNPINPSIRTAVFNDLFNDPKPPDIWWIIVNHRMWSRSGGWGAAPWGPPDSDPNHIAHLHVTYLD